MSMIRVKRAMLILAAMGCLGGAAYAQESGALDFAHTKPMRESAHTFDQIGIVKQVPVEVGQKVKKGDLLVQLDDRIDSARLKSLEVEANSSSQLDAAKAELEVSRVQLARKRQMNSEREGTASASEIQEAELTVTLNEIKVRIAEEKLAIAKLEVEQQRVKLEKMRVCSEFDGIVSKVDTSLGESVSPDRPVVTVVQNDPLRVVVGLPVEKVARLTPDMMLEVRYLDETDEPWRQAKIHFISPVAQANSGYQDIELLLPNPESRSAGLSMDVKLPARLDAPEAAAAAAGQ